MLMRKGSLRLAWIFLNGVLRHHYISLRHFMWMLFNHHIEIALTSTWLIPAFFCVFKEVSVAEFLQDYQILKSLKLLCVWVPLILLEFPTNIWLPWNRLRIAILHSKLSEWILDSILQRMQTLKEYFRWMCWYLLFVFSSILFINWIPLCLWILVYDFCFLLNFCLSQSLFYSQPDSWLSCLWAWIWGVLIL